MTLISYEQLSLLDQIGNVVRFLIFPFDVIGDVLGEVCMLAQRDTQGLQENAHTDLLLEMRRIADKARLTWMDIFSTTVPGSDSTSFNEPLTRERRIRCEQTC